ncbi:MAG: hypothetical protein U1E26_03930 [Coriobacteriia bacterium]|nr:hypothetical protein [Coriobacteriia bacterium]
MRQSTARLAAVLAALMLLTAAAPITAGAAPRAHKRLDRDGSVPKKWDLPTPVLPSDDTTPTDAGGIGDGHNHLSFARFDTGDIVCAFPGGFLVGHAGIFNDALHSSDYSKCVWSANKTPVSQVQLETPASFRNYDYAFGIWVPSKASYGKSVVSWSATHRGKPYDVNSSKTDLSRWYCSKLPWAGWKVRTGLDLDADGGYWVKPADLVNSRYTSTFAYSE